VTENDLRRRELRRLACKMRDAMEDELWDEVQYLIQSIRALINVIQESP